MVWRTITKTFFELHQSFAVVKHSWFKQNFKATFYIRKLFNNCSIKYRMLRYAVTSAYVFHICLFHCNIWLNCYRNILPCRTCNMVNILFLLKIFQQLVFHNDLRNCLNALMHLEKHFGRKFRLFNDKASLNSINWRFCLHTLIKAESNLWCEIWTYIKTQLFISFSRFICVCVDCSFFK